MITASSRTKDDDESDDGCAVPLPLGLPVGGVYCEVGGLLRREQESLRGGNASFGGWAVCVWSERVQLPRRAPRPSA